MKIKIADVPINILDGFAKYHQTSLVTAGLFFGFLSASVVAGQLPMILWSLVAGVGVLAAAWYVGRPK